MAINSVDSIGTTSSQVFPIPVVAQRDPSNAAGTKDFNYPIGQEWVNSLLNKVWFLSGFSLGLPVWQLIQPSGGAGVFTSLTVTGNSTFTGNILQSGGTVSMTSNGAFTLDGVAASTVALFNSVTTGSISMGTALTTGSVTIGGAQTTGSIAIGGGVQTGTITLGGGTGVQTVNLATGGTGAKTVHIGDGAAANVVTLGSTTASATTTIQASGTAAGSLTLNGAGMVSVTPVTGTSGTTTVVINAQVGVATYTGQTTASTATITLTVTNSVVAATSAILATLSNVGTNDAELTVQQVKPASGSFTVIAKNNGAASLNGNIILTFWVIAP